jgi:hypothetical protein
VTSASYLCREGGFQGKKPKGFWREDEGVEHGRCGLVQGKSVESKEISGLGRGCDRGGNVMCLVGEG